MQTDPQKTPINPNTCPYYDHEIESCNIITLLSEQPGFTPSQETCQACSRCSSPQRVNEVTRAVADNLRKDSHLPKLYSVGNGPGSILSSWLEWFITADPECDCENRAQIMDAWGPDGCRRNVNLIIHWLRSSASIKGIPFNSFVAQHMVGLAIKMSEKHTT